MVALTPAPWRTPPQIKTTPPISATAAATNSTLDRNTVGRRTLLRAQGDGIQGYRRLGIVHADVEVSRALVEAEREERAALALNRDQLRQRRAAKVRREVDRQRVPASAHLLDRARKATLALAWFILDTRRVALRQPLPHIWGQ
jgi:hypothetical protein